MENGEWMEIVKQLVKQFATHIVQQSGLARADLEFK